MFAVVIFLAFSVAACYGDVPAQQGTYCSYTPDEIYQCLRNPKIVDSSVAQKCSDPSYSECEKMTCIFRESGWLVDSKVDKKKVSTYFDQFAVDHPEWSTAVNHLKAACLDMELRAQRVVLNCPPYDVMHCVLTSFIRNAASTQWLTSKACAYPRAYAAACPVCPSSCFAPAVPYGSCNACLSLPRSP